MERKTITQDEIEICGNLLEGRQNIVIFDIGAADLTHSVRFRSKFNEAKIFSIEPDRNYQERNIHVARNFHIEYSPCVMVGEKKYWTRFYPSTKYKGYTGTDELWAGSGSIFKPNKEHIDKVYPTLEFDEVGYEVCSYTWDSFVESRKVDHVDWLHIDAQGAEYEIIKSATKSLPDFIFAEISDFETYHTGITLEDFDSMMFNKGYVMIASDEANALYLKAQKMF